MKYDDIARLLKGFAEPTRVRLVCLLLRFDMLCVCELTDILQLPQYHISRHLGMLRNLGIVSDERDGARVNYRLADAPAVVAQLAEVLGAATEGCPGAAQDLKRGKKVVGRRDA